MNSLFPVAILLVCAGFIGCDNGKKNTNDGTPSKSADTVFDSLKTALSPVVSDPPAAATIGDTVVNGVFVYRVASADFSKSLRSASMTVTAEGFFLRLFLTVSNNDSQPHALDKSLIKLVDEDNKSYECSGPAADILAMNGEKSLCNGTCKPGETVAGAIVFDVPSNNREYRLRVSNGAWQERLAEILLTNPKKQAPDSL